MAEESPQSSVAYLLGQLTAKVDLLLQNHKATIERHEALEGRVSNLERDKAKIMGGALVVSTVGGYIINYFMS